MKYDIIVIGAGSGGLTIARFMNSLRLKVLVVEKHLVGGCSLNNGSVPGKSLISIAHTVHCARKAEAFGIHALSSVDMVKVAAKIRERQDVVRAHENPDYLRGKGIDVLIGTPYFISTKAIAVNDRSYTARRIVIATGSRPAVPPIEGIETVDYLTNETIFSNKVLPGKLLVIGAGPVGIEIAQAYSRLGSKVTVVDIEERILPKEDPDISEALLDILKKEGIEFRLGVKPVRFLNKKSLRIVSAAKGGDKREETLSFDRVLVAAGRKLNIDGLDLDTAGIVVKNNKIQLDKYLRTTNKRVYCCGDAAGDFQFTHWAEYQASVVIRNMINLFKKPVNRDLAAWVTYTDPEVATFGLWCAAMEVRGITYRTVTVPLEDVDRAVCEGIKEGLLKLYIAKGKIMGGTLIARNAGEIVGELIAFAALKIPFSRLNDRIYPYPTLSRINRKAVELYAGRNITGRSPRISKLLYKLFNR